MKNGQIRKDYSINGEWMSRPEGRVLGVRYNFNPVSNSRLEDIARMWRYIKLQSIQPTVKADKILAQLGTTRMTDKPLILFSPWGPRYFKPSPKIAQEDPEIDTLKDIHSVLSAFRQVGFKIDFLLMPADVYGTEINCLSPDFVGEYYEELKQAALQELYADCLQIRTWSAIRAEQNSAYQEIKTEINRDFNAIVPRGEYECAVKVARFFNPSQAEESAKKYCIERIVEGQIINSVYNPIKLSLVRKEKDALDGPLKTIYVIKNRAPWLGGRK